MKTGIIGDGAIARFVRAHIATPHALLVRPARRTQGADNLLRVTRVEDLPDDTQLVVDCAGHAALAEHGPKILERGMPLVTVSLGALADAGLYAQLEAAAKAGRTRLHLASGAIGALDCLQAAKVGGLTEVTYTGRKPPAGWKGSAAEMTVDLDALEGPVVHFEGSARNAATSYPKNANVAAAVALAGLGFDATRVRLIADPLVSANIHEIQAAGAFGSFTFQVEGKALPDNPRSSALAAMSVVAAIAREHAAVVV